MKKSLSILFLSIKKISLFIAASIVILTQCGCKGPVVVIYYDQTHTFQRFEFNQFRLSQNGTIAGIRGIWATFNICDVSNTDKDAKDFPYDIRRFYVEYGTEKYYYKDLQFDTYYFLPNRYSPMKSEHEIVVNQFRNATQLGPETDVFKPGYHRSLNFRFSIFVPSSMKEEDATFKLYYDHKNQPTTICVSRNQDPIFSYITRESDLRGACRPPAK